MEKAELAKRTAVCGLRTNCSAAPSTNSAKSDRLLTHINKESKTSSEDPFPRR